MRFSDVFLCLLLHRGRESSDLTSTRTMGDTPSTNASLTFHRRSIEHASYVRGSSIERTSKCPMNLPYKYDSGRYRTIHKISMGSSWNVREQNHESVAMKYKRMNSVCSDRTVHMIAHGCSVNVPRHYTPYASMVNVHARSYGSILLDATVCETCTIKCDGRSCGPFSIKSVKVHGPSTEYPRAVQGPSTACPWTTRRGHRRISMERSRSAMEYYRNAMKDTHTHTRPFHVGSVGSSHEQV